MVGVGTTSCEASGLSPRAWRTRGTRARRAGVASPSPDILASTDVASAAGSAGMWAPAGVVTGTTASDTLPCAACAASVISGACFAARDRLTRFRVGASSVAPSASPAAVVARVRRDFGDAAAGDASPDISPESDGCSAAARVERRRFGGDGSAASAAGAEAGVVAVVESLAAAASVRRVRRRVGVRVS